MAEESAADFFYRMRGELEQLADELVVPDFVLNADGDFAEKVDAVKQRLSRLADEHFESYLRELRRA